MSPLHLFQAVGIELEYAIIHRDTFAVLPIADAVLQAAAGTLVNDFPNGPIAWSNELPLHVIELKTNGPVPELTDVVASDFLADVRQIDALAAQHGGRLLPGAMHPMMDPLRDTKLWPHGDRALYQAFDEAFDCRGHGWSNLQSCHVNLPFEGPEEFGRLHAAIRPILPLIPALGASSPVVEGHVTGTLDSRIAAYRKNHRRVPFIIGHVVPEPVYTPDDYFAQVLSPMYQAVQSFDREGYLRREWLNARGAIARFERNAIEIRLLDLQETPLCDIAMAHLIAAVVEALDAERFVSHAELRALSTERLAGILDRTVVDGERARIDEPEVLRAFGFDRPATAGEIWTALYEAELHPGIARDSAQGRVLAIALEHGPLARRLLTALGPDPSLGHIVEVYGELADGLLAGRPFVP